jgi:2-keto-3-deoxy-L-rhamnonate aldolase RhmA
MTPPSRGAGFRSNRLKELLDAGKHAVGTWILTVRTPAIVRMIAAADLDFVFIDMQHSSFSWETVGDMCEMARSCGLAPIVRPHQHAQGVVNRIQDIGAMGVMYPDVRERTEVEAFVRTMSYPPSGSRGSTSLAAPTDYLGGDGAELRRLVDANTLLAIQIESRDGVEHLDDILRGGGVDLVEVGRGDLSAELGVPQETRHPAVLAALDEVIATSTRHKVAVGANCHTIEDAAELISRGVRCISYASDRHLLIRSYHDAAESLRALLPNST